MSRGGQMNSFMKTAVAIAVSAAAGFAQAPAKDPDTLQALLVEVRQLRQNIEAMTVASQRVQIALYGLQMQDAAVARTAQRLDDARKRLEQSADARDHAAAELARAEELVSKGAVAEPELKHFQMMLPQVKKELETRTAEVQSRQVVESEAASQFRIEQV